MRNISTRHGIAKMHGGTIRRAHHTSPKVESHAAIPAAGGGGTESNLDRLRQSLANMTLHGAPKKQYVKF